MVLHDGNGRTGRMILFRECLYHGIAPFIIEDANRPEYLDALKRRDSIDFIISKRTGILLESLSVLSGRINVYYKSQEILHHLHILLTFYIFNINFYATFLIIQAVIYDIIDATTVNCF